MDVSRVGVCPFPEPHGYFDIAKLPAPAFNNTLGNEPTGAFTNISNARLQYTWSSIDEPPFVSQSNLPCSSALQYQPYSAGWGSSASPTSMTGQSLVDGSNLTLGLVAAETGSNGQAFVLNEEHSALAGVRSQGTLNLKQTASPGLPDLVDLGNSLKGRPAPNESSNIDPITRCDCIRCLEVCIRREPFSGLEYSSRSCWQCRVPNCDQTFRWPSERNRHEGRHFSDGGKYVCNAHVCTRSFKRWVDLIRHTSDKHCLNPQLHPCPELGCKYSGDNGFRRKDKMMSHYKNAHEGKPKIFLGRPAGIPQAILPAPGGDFSNIGSTGPANGYGAIGREKKRVRRF